MSYIDNVTLDLNTAQYIGPNSLTATPEIAVGELKFRLRLTSATNCVAEVASIAGSKSYEFYNVESYGGGGLLNRNADSINITTTWVTTDADAIFFVDGSDRQDLVITPTLNTEGKLYRVTLWHPTPTKCCMVAEYMDATATFPANVTTDFAVHMHRVNLGDFPTVSVFNGQSYAWADWVPAIVGMSVTATGPYTNVGLNFRPNASGNIELYGDAFGSSEAWKLDLCFTKRASTKFGTFN